MKNFLIGCFFICLFRLFIFSCDIEIVSSEEKPIVGSTVELTIKIFFEHRRCLIKPEDTNFKLTGLKITENGDWKKEGSLAIFKKIKVNVVNSEAAIEVSRHCSKKELSFARFDFFSK